MMIPQTFPNSTKPRLIPAMGLAGALLAGGWLLVPAARADYAGRAQQVSVQEATRFAAAANRALAQKKPAQAILAAEQAVGAAPTSADFRFLLGDAYLSDGRFQSAASAYQDCLTLKPDHAKAGFKLALTKIALGDAAKARDLLVTHQSALTVSDYGLAQALAGDTDAGIRALEEAVRSGEDNAKLRQNLALAYALAGRWDAARAQAAVDLTPDLVAQRMADWASFAKPGQGMAQISRLLDIQPRTDVGLPAALALKTAGPAALRDLVSAEPQEVPPPVAQATNIDPQTPPPSVSAYFEAPPEVKDPVRVHLAQGGVVPQTSSLTPQKDQPNSTAKTRAMAASGKGYVVQIGAFKSSQSVASAWTQSLGRWPILQRYGARQARHEAGIYRLSVGGFASRAEANRLCQSLRTKGGQSFTRVLNKTDLIRWAARQDAQPRQLALR